MRSFNCAVVLFFVSLFSCGHAFAQSTASNIISATELSVPGDRWMEIDLYWFDQNALSDSVNHFWDRFLPLYQGVQGDRGLILNVGWTVGYIMEFSGDLQQSIPLPANKGQQPWVQETGPLPGTPAERLQEWKSRFAKPIMVERKGYGVWTYGDLRNLAMALREEAARRGIRNFKVGGLTYAWTHAYGEVAPWATRHPEAFTASSSHKDDAFDVGRYFDPGAKLHRDDAKLGGLPHGITEGLPVHAAFAAQWGSLSKTVGLNAIMLRDSFGMPVPYQRAGPYGGVVPSPELIQAATASVSALLRETKTANPAALVMMYSNAASALADWRSNGLDLERLAKEGYLDIYVDQTWAGAWNEVGVRHDSFWNSPTLGWTYQLTYMLLHSAMLADTKVRHYPLVETFDAWESWDVLHTVPQRLRWGIWAYSHASVKTPHGIKVPDGTYISWANQGKRLLEPEDVQFLSTNISEAVIDAHKVDDVPGPTLVYARSAAQWQAEHAQPDYDVKEWIDEQVGSLIKWPVPVLSATRIEWLPQIHSDLLILGAPSHLTEPEAASVATLAQHGQPIALFGSPAGGISPKLQKLFGLGTHDETRLPLSIQAASASDFGSTLVRHLPSQFPVKQSVTRNFAAPKTNVVYSVSGSPVLVMNTASSTRLVAWDPPDFYDSCCKPLKEIWGGSAAPYALAAGALNKLLSDANALHASEIDMEQTSNISVWHTSDGKFHLLAGNLEEGLRDDADMTRRAAIALPDAWSKLQWRSVWPDAAFSLQDHMLHLTLPMAGSLHLEAPGR